MSHSPSETASSNELLRYDKGWAALNQLLRAGGSFSGRERHCCFLNIGQGRFADVSSATGLSLIDDGRALAIVDWDFDGDLDFWIYNRTGPRVRFLRNENSSENQHLAVLLQGTDSNRDAIGARLELYLGKDGKQKIIKSLRTGEGYLAQSSKWIHFGLGINPSIDRLVVRWPSGTTETFKDLQPNNRYRLVEGSSEPAVWPLPRKEIRLKPSTITPPSLSDNSRVVLLRAAPMPDLNYVSTDGKRKAILSKGQGPLLVNLWATWCKPCLVEMSEWSNHRSQLQNAGLDILSICVDRLNDIPISGREVKEFAEKLNYTFPVGIPAEGLIDGLEVVQRTFIGRQTPLPVPSSFLLDGEGRLAVIYKGPVQIDQLLKDMKILQADSRIVLQGALPFPGKWSSRPPATEPRKIALKFIDGGYQEQAEDYLKKLLAWLKRLGPKSKEIFWTEDVTLESELAEVNAFLGAINYDRQDYQEAANYYAKVLRTSPGRRATRLEMIRTLQRLNRPADAAKHLEKILQAKRDDPENLVKLALLRSELNELDVAIALYRESLAIQPNAMAEYHLARAYLRQSKIAEAIKHYHLSLELRPKWAPPANDLAWILATTSRSELRDGSAAVKLALIACQETNFEDPSFLGTLAAAYAEAGQFPKAVETAKEVISILSNGNHEAALERAKQRLSLFEQGRAYHATAP